MKQTAIKTENKTILHKCGRHIRFSALVFMLIWGMPHAFAQNDTDSFKRYTPLTDHDLQGLRGGFVTPNGLEINIGVEKMVFVNDTLQSKLVMDLSEINRSSLSTNTDGYMQLIQLGANNTLSPEVRALIASGALNVIQNTLDNQKIGHITQLDIGIKNFKNMVIPELGKVMDFELARSLSSIR